LVPPDGGCCEATRSSPTNGKGATPRSGTFAAVLLCDNAPDSGLAGIGAYCRASGTTGKVVFDSA